MMSSPENTKEDQQNAVMLVYRDVVASVVILVCGERHNASRIQSIQHILAVTYLVYQARPSFTLTFLEGGRWRVRDGLTAPPRWLKQLCQVFLAHKQACTSFTGLPQW